MASLLNCRHQVHTQGFLKNKIGNESTLMLTFYLSFQNDLKLTNDLLIQHPSKRNYLSHEEHNTLTSVEDNFIKRFKEHFDHENCTIIEVDKTKRLIKVGGSIQHIEKALNIEFFSYQDIQGHEFYYYHGVVTLPQEISKGISYIAGLHKGLQLAERFRAETVNDPELSPKGFSPNEIANIYNFPEGDGEGTCIGIIELGGTHKKADLEGYFEHFNLPCPDIEIVGDIPESSASTSLVNDLEVTMDIELAAGLAPKSKIVLYYATSISEALHLAIYDEENSPDVLSISWAMGETQVSDAMLQEMAILTYQATLKGITIVAASGDKGAWEVGNIHSVGINFPAALPYIMACGGTKISDQDQQTVWNELKAYHDASGGGFSRRLPAPWYQKNALFNYSRYFPSMPMEYQGVPDIAMNASVNSPYTIFFKGKLMGKGAGTSASTPVVAAYIARLNQKLGYRLGFANALFYSLMSGNSFNTQIPGNNGVYTAVPDWNPCVGLGTLHGTNLMSNIQKEAG